MIKEMLKDLKDLRDEMLSVNWPAQRLSNIILKYEMKMKEDPIERFKQREKEEVEALRRVSYEAKEEDETYQANKQDWKLQNPNDTIHRHKELYIKGFIDELPWENMPAKEEPPMPLEQWNALIESAEKEVAKEEPKKKTSNYIMRAETGDKQVKVKDRIVADEQK